MTILRSTLTVALVCALLPGDATGQQPAPMPITYCDIAAGQPTPLSGALQELLRMNEVSTGTPSRPRSMVRPSDGFVRRECGAQFDGGPEWSLGPLRIGIIAPEISTRLNTGYPDDRNNGAAWAGRGLTSTVEAGVSARIGPLTAAFAPMWSYQQNRDFTTVVRERAGLSPYINRFYTHIDLPQRFGPDSYGTVDPGQSFIRLDAFGATFGVSTENYWVGPAARNPILMSNTAPGFEHVFFGTSYPIDIWIARVSARGVLGRLRESEYFDENPDNDESRLAMWAIALQPRWLDGLEIGGSRVYLYREGTIDGLDELLVLFKDSEQNLFGNELSSLFARWVMPSADAEVYAEWAREDRYAGWLEDLIPEPDHSQAYMIGLQKLSPIGDRRLRVQAELTHLQEKVERRGGRPLPIFYVHHQIRQGYTNRGQLLGAAIGPGADAQFIGVDVVDDWGFAGLFVERVRRNDGSVEAIAARSSFPYSHDVELTAGLRGFLSWRDFAGWASASYSWRWLRDFIEDDRNAALELGVTWYPRPMTPAAGR